MLGVIQFISVVTMSFVMHSHAQDHVKSKSENGLLVSLDYEITFCDEMQNNDLESGYSFDDKGNVDIQGYIAGTSSNTANLVMLYETEGKDFFLIDSANVVNDSFFFSIENAQTGLYKIGYGDKTEHLSDVILNYKESPLKLQYSKPNLMYGLTSVNGFENQGLAVHGRLMNKHDSDIKSLQRSSMERELKRKAIYERDADLKRSQDSLAKAYSGTFFANMVSHLQSPNRFDKNSYWNDLDFMDISLIHSTIYPDRIEDYMRIHAAKEKSPSNPLLGFYNAVDVIANKIKNKGSDEVLEFVLYTLSEGFYSSGMEQLSLYVIDNYFYGDACGDAEISDLFKMKAAGIRNLQVGSTSPNFILSTSTENAVELNKLAAESSYTLILFWASFCHICEREIPELKKVFQQYGDSDLSIIAISVDTNKQAWLQGVNSHDMGSWHNVSDLEGWRGTTTKDYRVTSTPKMFLVNQDREVVARPKDADDLKNFLASSVIPISTK